MVAENSLVAIRTATNMCFGVVIASRFVLFAADCITDDELDDLNLSAGRENIEAHAIHKSPQHPIAMIQLKYDRDISMCIEPRTVFIDSIDQGSTHQNRSVITWLNRARLSGAWIPDADSL